MSGNQKHYFVCATSSKGFVNLFDTNLIGLKKIYLIKGGPGTGASSLMKFVGATYLMKGIDVEFIHCCQDPDSLDGVILRSIGVGIVDATAPHILEPKVPGAIEEYVNLGSAWDTDLLAKSTNEIIKLNEDIAVCYREAYKQFAKALLIHDDWEKIYIRSMDFKAADDVSQELIKELLGDVSAKEQGVTRYRFFGVATHLGVMDFFENLTKLMKKRYFIKGRPGSGKSTMLKKIQKKAEQLGLEVEVYHCGFDPDSVDMLMFPQLELCIFDSTAPHEYEPSREGDIIVDMYQRTIRFGTDEENEAKLDQIKSDYKAYVQEGTTYLKKAKALQDELEVYYEAATDLDMVQQITNDLIYKIRKYKK
jgi:hypothetical protein